MADYNLSGLSVLVVEDHRHMRKILCGVLNRLGVNKICDAATVDEALQLFKDTEIDLILTDWSPGIDGIRLLNHVRRSPDSVNPYVPIIVVTAHTDIHWVYRARDAGMTEFLAKPLSATLLYSRIRTIIERQRLFVRSTKFFGPDRRRRRADFHEAERRRHRNIDAPNRRKRQVTHTSPERRRGFPGYVKTEDRQIRPI